MANIILENASKILIKMFEAEQNDRYGRDYCFNGKVLSLLTGLTPGDINDAVNLLDDRDFIERQNVLGTAPYRFGSVRLNSKGRYEYHEITAKRQQPQIQPISINTPFTTSDSKYQGQKILLDFQDADIGSIFRLFADISGYNLVLDPSVRGKITIRLLNTPWDQALDIILQTFSFSKAIEGNVIWIAPASTFAIMAEERLAPRYLDEKAAELVQEILQINYASANDISSIIMEGKLLSPRGTITKDIRTNKLIVKDTQRSLDNLKELLKNIDVPAIFSQMDKFLSVPHKEEKMLNDYLSEGENATVEFKSSLRWDIKLNQTNKELEKNIAETVAGFLNSDGGRLFVGVSDDRTIYGIENDIKTLGKKDKDGFQQILVQTLTSYLGAEFSQYIKISFQEKEAKVICVVRMGRSHREVYLSDRGNTEFYIRAGNTTRRLNVKETHDYISMHWRGDGSNSFSLPH